MKLSNFPRKKYLIDDLQYRVLLTSMLYILAVVLVFVGTVFLPLMVTLESDVSPSPAVRDAAQEFLALHSRVWPPVLGLIALLVVHNILFTHRIVGPLYRIRNELRKIGDGNLFVQVKLRGSDYLDKEAASVNEMVDALRMKIRTIEQNQKKASAALVELQRALIRGSADEMNDQIDELGGILERLKISVDQFQIPRDQSRVAAVRPAAAATDKTGVDPAPAGASKSV